MAQLKRSSKITKFLGNQLLGVLIKIVFEQPIRDLMSWLFTLLKIVWNLLF